MSVHHSAHYEIPVTAFAQNCALVWCAVTKKAVVIDPGGDIERVVAAIEHFGIEPEKILLTHGHLDHVGGSLALAERYQIPIWGSSQEDRYWFEGLAQQSRQFGFPPAKNFEPDRWLSAGDEIIFGERRFEVLHCPGHTPGHVVFFDRETSQVWVGDVLFAGSVGRSDFPGGNHAQLVKSIREQLFPLGDHVEVFSGHGPETSIGEERQFNPYVADRVGM